MHMYRITNKTKKRSFTQYRKNRSDTHQLKTQQEGLEHTSITNRVVEPSQSFFGSTVIDASVNKENIVDRFKTLTKTAKDQITQFNANKKATSNHISCVDTFLTNVNFMQSKRMEEVKQVKMKKNFDSEAVNITEAEKNITEYLKTESVG